MPETGSDTELLRREPAMAEGDLPKDIAHFIAAAVVSGDLVLPWNYPESGELAEFQTGYRWHGHTGECLVSTEPGGWQPGWLVIAQNYFGDPFFIDRGEEITGFPVYYAPHGAGRWDAVMVARSCRHFGMLLAALREFPADPDGANALNCIEAYADPANPLWREVVEARREREEEQALAGAADAAIDLSSIEQGDLVITDIGTQKLQILQILRKTLDLPLSAALALATQREITVGSGPRVRFGRIQRDLLALGASVEFRPSSATA